jgi:hypothetical protein
MAAEVDSFSSAISFWKNANLGSLQNELDQQGLEIVEKQKDGLISRKKLAEQTRGTAYNTKGMQEPEWMLMVW